jgi:protein TonB
VQEETIDVSLVKAPDLPDPEPEIEVQPEAKPEVVKKRKPRKKASVSTPTAIPEGVPDEADPNQNPFNDELDDVFDGEGSVNAQPKKVVVAPQKKVAPPIAVPLFVSEREHSVAPVPLAQPRPAYPPDARSAGIQGTVVVRFLVTAQGTVGDVRVVRGEPELARAVVQMVKAWRFEPGTYRGTPISMWRTASFPFRLRS